MRRLFTSELLRARSRRLPWVLMIGATIGIVLGIGIGTLRSTPPDAAAPPPPRQYRLDLEACLSGEFLGPGDEVPPGFGSLEEFCNETVRPEFYGEPVDRIELRDLRSILESLGTIVVLVGVVIGASLAGADWSMGSMATLLTWEPRRALVLLVRVAVVVVAVLVMTMAAQVLFIALWRAGVAWRGSAASASPDWLGQVVGVAVRTSVIAAAFGVIAAALATIGRSSVAAIGILLGYLVAIEGFLSGLVEGSSRWLLVRAAAAVVSQRPVTVYRQDTYEPEVVLSVAGAGVLVAAYVAVLVLLAAAAFRARDVN